MDELVRSVRTHGVLEPLLVRRAGDNFQLIAGERRLRAAQQAGLKEVPVIFLTGTDLQSLEISLVENLQREDLNPVDEARAYLMMTEEFHRTHEQVAAQVGKDRSTVTNLLRLLRLPSTVLTHLAEGSISTGHARVLLALDNPELQERWCERIIEEGWSVREAERRLGDTTGTTRPKSKKRAAARSVAVDPHIGRVEEAIRRRVGSEVHLHVNKRGGGRLELVYADQVDLERILDLLGVQVH